MPPKPKLTPAQNEDLRRRKAADPGIPHSTFAEEFGVHKSTISRALAETNLPSPALPGDSVILLSHDALNTSPLNPRKTFDQAALEEFADNLADRGVLQNLLVRERPDGVGYWITAGERRWRAIGMLVAQGRWDAAERNIPCRVINGDDAQHRITAIIENLQRVDVPVLEEAQAFVDLNQSDPTQWTPQIIARLISKTPRYVYQRMALATRLSETVKDYLHDNRISIEAARMLSGQEPDTQLDILGELEDYTYISAEDVRHQLANVFIPLSRAIFDVDELNEATGEIAIYTDNEGEKFFESRAQFWKLQTEAMQARAAALTAPDFPIGPWGWSKISTPETRRRDQAINYITDEACAKDRCGVIIFADAQGIVEEIYYLVEQTKYDDGDILSQATEASEPSDHTQDQDQAEGDVGQDQPAATAPQSRDGAKPTEQPEAQKAIPDSQRPVTKSHIYHAHRRKTVALRDAMAADWETAMRLTVFSLLCPNNNSLTISGGIVGIDDRVALTANHGAMIGSKLGKVKLPAPHEHTGKKAQALLAHILAMPAVELKLLFAAVTAQYIITPAGYNADLGDSPTVLAIAAHMKLQGDEEDQGLTVIREDLNGVRKQTLLSIADEAGTPGVNDALSPGSIADTIAKKSKNYVLPTLRFASTAEIEKALKFK